MVVAEIGVLTGETGVVFDGEVVLVEGGEGVGT